VRGDLLTGESAEVDCRLDEDDMVVIG
jgi:hypothetical protein